MELVYIVKKNNSYKDVSSILKGYFHISRNLLIKLRTNNKILLNNAPASTSRVVSEGDIISVRIDFEEESSNIVPTKMELNILYEDDSYIVLNKPAGIAVHPSVLHYADTLSNGVKFYFDSIKLKKKIRPVNRLDRNTSGIVVFAKNEYIQECLVKQMEQKTFVKEYVAILNGILKEKSGTINAPICRKENSIIERCVCPDGDASITHYKVIKYINNLSVVEIILETGRTHQIRVHTAHIGHSVLGDTLYGISSNLINRQALHAYKVRFIHPTSNKCVEYVAKIPGDMQVLLLCNNSCA